MRNAFKLFFVFCAALFLNAPSYAQVDDDGEKEGKKEQGEQNIIPGRLMAQMKKGVGPDVLTEDLRRMNGKGTELKVMRKLSEYLNVWLFSYDPDAVNKHRLLKRVRRHEGTGMAQFEHRMERRAIPNDPMFSSPDKWPYVNDGSGGGVVDADTDADLAWDITTGGTTVSGDTIVVAVIDGGAQVDHEDLNIFKNQEEVNGTPGVDDDGNGYVDDVNGWDVYNGDGTIPTDGHGTHVSGTVGAIGDNNTGFVGVNWNVEVMPIAGSSQNESTVVSAYDYAVKMRDMYDSTNGSKGAFIVATNSSFGVNQADPSNFPLWCAMYDTLGAYGITNAVAGPNLDIDIDTQGDVPGTCPSPHTICLTNTQNDDSRAAAGYGDVNVDLGAPGSGILSTEPGDTYGQKSGTSMASPHVAGAVGLLYSVDCPELMALTQNDPDSASMLIKEAILKGTDQTSAMTNMTVSDGRLNLHKALLELDSLGICDTNTGCFDPYGLNVASLTDTSAVLHFDGPTASDSIKVQYKESSAATWTSEWTSSVDSFSIPDGLSGCTSYEFRVRAYCPTDTSNWAGPRSFQSKGCCDAPSGFGLMSNGERSLEVEWNGVYGASGYDLEYRSVDSTGWKQLTGINGTDTSIRELNPCHEYEMKVRADCDTGNSPFTSVITRNTLCSPCDSASYCASEGQDTQFEWLERVEIQSLSAVSSDNGGYLFKKGPNAVLWEDSSYVITLEPQYSSSTYQEYFRIWIDLNRSGTFDPPDELVFMEDAVTSTITDTLTIPNNIDSGGSRMRISMKYDGVPGPCESFDFGEVEDYCVRLMTRSGKDSSDQSLEQRSKGQRVSLFPNPAKDRINLHLKRTPEEGSYFVLHDVLGNKVLEEPVQKARNSFDISSLSAGTYFYRLVNDEVLSKGKLVIEGR